MQEQVTPRIGRDQVAEPLVHDFVTSRADAVPLAGYCGSLNQADKESSMGVLDELT